MKSYADLSTLIANFELFLAQITKKAELTPTQLQITKQVLKYLKDLQQSQENSKLAAEIEHLKSVKSRLIADILNLTSQKTEGIDLAITPPSLPSHIQRLTDLFSAANITPDEEKDIWYLGLDFGSLGMAAVLFNLTEGKQYPLLWRSSTLDPMKSPFRFPSLLCRSHKQGSWYLGGLESPETEDLVVDSYKPYLDQFLPQVRNSSSLETLIYTVSQLFWQLHSAVTEDLPVPFLRQALGELQGIIVNCPAGWSDTYRFNLREMILQSHLVSTPDQIFFLEEAIATLLGRLDSDASLQGWTMVINSGSSTTEIALVQLPENPQNLTDQDFSLETVAYAQQALAQDIFTQFIYPATVEPKLPLWKTTIPRPGKVDGPQRQQLNLHLQNHPVIATFMEAAKLIGLMLPNRMELEISLGNNYYQIRREDLEQMIIAPFLADLEQIIIRLCQQRKIEMGKIQQVICSGGLFCGIFPLWQPWLAEKFPEARVMGDTEAENALRVAQGLACLPRFPQILRGDRHQYSDYFLLQELLAVLPTTTFTLEELMRKLAARGINTRLCGQRLIRLMTGKLPPGILTYSGQKSLIVPQSSGAYTVSESIRSELTQSLSQVIFKSRQGLHEPLLIMQ